MRGIAKLPPELLWKMKIEVLNCISIILWLFLFLLFIILDNIIIILHYLLAILYYILVFFSAFVFILFKLGKRLPHRLPELVKEVRMTIFKIGLHMIPKVFEKIYLFWRISYFFCTNFLSLSILMMLVGFLIWEKWG